MQYWAPGATEGDAVRVGPSREAGGGEPGGMTYKRYLPSINRITGTVEWI